MGDKTAGQILDQIQNIVDELHPIPALIYINLSYCRTLHQSTHTIIYLANNDAS